MDGMSPTQQPPQQRNNFFVGTFVFILFLLLLLILNYFNILKLSTLLPDYLVFLPHRPYEVSQDKKTNPIRQSFPTPDLNYSPKMFEYDTEKAKQILTTYIKKTIRPELLPEKLYIKEGLSIDNRTEDNNKRQFGSYFTTSQATFSINFHYKENTNTPNDFIIFIQPSNIDETTLTPDLANSFVSSYFNNPFTPISNCYSTRSRSHCEEFKSESDGKRGYGVVFAKDPSKTPPEFTPVVFSCFIPKESNEYNTQNSCISL